MTPDTFPTKAVDASVSGSQLFRPAIAAPASVKPTEGQSLIGFFVAANYHPAGM